MILIVEDRTAFEASGSGRAHECSLRETLRRMGFHAAQPRRLRRRAAAAARSSGDAGPGERASQPATGSAPAAGPRGSHGRSE